MKDVENSPAIKKAVRSVFKQILAMTPEELEEAIGNAPDDGFGRMMVESGAHEVLMENIKAKEKLAV